MLREMYLHNLTEDMIKARIVEEVDLDRFRRITDSTLEGSGKTRAKPHSQEGACRSPASGKRRGLLTPARWPSQGSDADRRSRGGRA